MIRLGLCCLFKEEDIRFRQATARYVAGKRRGEQLAYLSDLCLLNAQALQKALLFCRDNGIGDFRVNSQIWPLKTHPDVGYQLKDLPGAGDIETGLASVRMFAQTHNIRLTLHPDQFTLLSSPDPGVTRRSLAELEYQAEFAERVGADVINIHGGGAYGDKPGALSRLKANIGALKPYLRSRLTLENDDRVYTPRDLLPLCLDTGIPLVYDVHHHRCLSDGWSEAEATEKALSTWDREPLFHLSSPLGSWDAKQPRKHDDFIAMGDFPECWRDLDITVEVEAKAKEIAVLRLAGELASR